MKTKAIVTGGCGFIGSNLVDKLVSSGYEVIVVDDLSSGKREHMNQGAKYVFEDFKTYLLKPDESIDIVFHLAAQSRIQPSFESPLSACLNNSYGSSIVGEFARH